MGEQVPLEVVHPDERDPTPERDPLPVGEPNEERSDEPGAVGGGDEERSEKQIPASSSARFTRCGSLRR